MRRISRRLVPVLVLVTACGTGSAATVRADVPRETTTGVSDEELGALVEGDRTFAFDLFGEVAGTGNVILSPYSAVAALTMAYAGARGPTAAEMADVLSFGVADDRIHAARNELDLRLTAPAEGDDDEEPFTLRVSNSLWAQEGYPFLEEFLTVLAANYDAGMNLVDFAAAAEEARRAINDRVADDTGGRITELLPEGAVGELTRLVLVNAIWFTANWAEPFDPARTADGPFTLLDGSTVTVPLMHGGGSLPYVRGDGYDAVRLPYAGDASMLVVVPDEGGFEKVAAAFGPADLAAIAGTESVHEVDLTLPRFELRTDVSLSEALRGLGMVAAFTDPSLPGGADFTGMTEARELVVSDVIQEAFIAVDEAGTEAAAATAVVVGITSAAPPATVTVDRPFLFFIERSGEILFLGQVTDPGAQP